MHAQKMVALLRGCVFGDFAVLYVGASTKFSRMVEPTLPQG
jgi:hypothetical protein